MTDRVSHLIVTLKEDTRIDDVEDIVKLIGQIGAVSDVTAGSAISPSVEVIERHRIRSSLRDQVVTAVEKILWPERA